MAMKRNFLDRENVDKRVRARKKHNTYRHTMTHYEYPLKLFECMMLFIVDVLLKEIPH